MNNRYSPVQNRGDNDTTDFIIRSSPALNVADAVLKQDGGRSIDLEPYTLFAKIADDQKYTPYINNLAVDGTAIPAGIYIGPTIAAADIVAGDIPNISVLVLGAWFDESKLIMEAKTLDAKIGAGTVHVKTVRDYLYYRGLIPMPTSTSSGGEN